MIFSIPDRRPAQQYVGEEMPVDETSLAGYVAATGETLVIDDAHQIPSDAPYAFNKRFDESSGYRTQSVLVVPLITSQGRGVGVLEIINAKDGANTARPFSKQERLWVEFYSHHAAIAVERTQLTQELILRMISIAELRDPLETGVHVNRVGGYAAEIYEGWAKAQGVHAAEMKKHKDLIRVASMLHDVGKVAISDAILKKSGRLTPDEFRAMQYHTVAGAKLFENANSELDVMARDIALGHHERWDGKGYPGRLNDLDAPWQGPGAPKKAEDISIEARITCLADVYDALVSPRVYKEPWPEGRVLELIENEKGNQFDPMVVEAFFSVYELIQLVRNRFS
jgi:response regulator RpfG family c-di-GMP phosphodiesterase